MISYRLTSYYKFTLKGGGFLVTDQVEKFACPNEYYGIGDARFSGIPGEYLWTGGCHVSAPFYSIHIADIVAVESRSTLNETPEPWELLWEAPERFSYEPYFQLGDLLREKFPDLIDCGP